jgi:hypothetical protein
MSPAAARVALCSSHPLEEALAARSASAQAPSVQAACWGPFDLQRNLLEALEAHPRVCPRAALLAALLAVLPAAHLAQEEAREPAAQVAAQTPTLDQIAPPRQQ